MFASTNDTSSGVVPRTVNISRGKKEMVIPKKPRKMPLADMKSFVFIGLQNVV